MFIVNQEQQQNQIQGVLEETHIINLSILNLQTQGDQIIVSQGILILNQRIILNQAIVSLHITSLNHLGLVIVSLLGIITEVEALPLGLQEVLLGVKVEEVSQGLVEDIADKIE